MPKRRYANRTTKRIPRRFRNEPNDTPAFIGVGVLGERPEAVIAFAAGKPALTRRSPR